MCDGALNEFQKVISGNCYCLYYNKYYYLTDFEYNYKNTELSKELMNNTKSLFSIAHDHLHVLMLAQMVKRGSQITEGMPDSLEGKAKYVIRFFDLELENHFYIEEHVLQPEVEGISTETDEIFKHLVKEHDAIRDIIKLLKHGQDLEENLDRFGNLLEEHIKNEERNFFPKIQRILSEDALEKLALVLKEKGYGNL